MFEQAAENQKAAIVKTNGKECQDEYAVTRRSPQIIQHLIRIWLLLPKL